MNSSYNSLDPRVEHLSSSNYVLSRMYFSRQGVFLQEEVVPLSGYILVLKQLFIVNKIK